MAAKKLYFIRSCSSSSSVRSEAVSSSCLWSSRATLCISRWFWRTALSAASSSRIRSAQSRRHSITRGLKVPHSPLRIMPMAFSWG